MDRAGTLIDKLLDLRDLTFDPPPFVAAVAEEVLGPSGAMLTPHRRLLERANGAYLHHHALHLFGACESPDFHSLRLWNAASTWRDTYRPNVDGVNGVAAAADEPALVFFAEDAFGDQFAYTGRGGEVVVFEAELGRVAACASSFVEWLEEMLERPRGLLPVDLVEAQVAQQKRLQAGSQLFAYPPLFSSEAREDVAVGHVDAVEAMRFRGQLARQIRGLPPGTRVEIDLGDLATPPTLPRR